MSSVSPCRALVRPRVISQITGDAVLLEDEIADLLQTQKRHVVALWGPRCSGKTTALRHLAAVLSDDRLLLLDDDPGSSQVWTVRHRVLVFVLHGNYKPDVVLNMAPWIDDDVLEYLLAVSPARTASVMGRWRNTSDQDLVEGCPELVRVVLDRMIANDSIHSVRMALHDVFRQFLADDDLLRRGGMFSLATLQGLEKDATRFAARLKSCLPPKFLRLLNPEGPRRVLAALHITRSVITEQRVLHSVLSNALIHECAAALAVIPAAEDALSQILKNNSSEAFGMAVSILHAAGLPTEVESRPNRNLAHAVLNGIAWRGAMLQGAIMRHASLMDADLSQSNLEHADLHLANLSGASLQRALLQNANGAAADLTAADLSHAIMENSIWEKAKFVRANLRCANLSHARLSGADFRGADLSGADLGMTDLTFTKLDGADLRNANLSFAHLTGVRLRDAYLDGANFHRAHLVDCDLEGVQLDSPNFRYAELQKALLTGSVMDAPNFQHADLRETGLADIQWQNADLRNADLRGASFHLGSTRCGLVDSPYPSHGTRTGFYTNEYDEQNFRAPEDIRKADLRGADLRGANIEGVDFYLVDLRGARYDLEQLQHLQHCDAILHDRTIN